nr:unnamed protein product [Callosobruchus analis]
MPKVREGATYRKIYNEADATKAVTAVKSGMSQRNAAITCNVPRATTLFRMNEKFKDKITPGPSPVLTYEDEGLLKRWIMTSHRKGFPLRTKDLQTSVKKFLDDNPRSTPFTDNNPGEWWYKAFLRRHPNISLRTADAVTAASSTVAGADVKIWEGIEEYLEEKKSERIPIESSNCVYICMPSIKRALAPKVCKNVYEIQHYPKASITVLFNFCANGDTTPPMMV